jgi:hypothetical protein
MFIKIDTINKYINFYEHLQNLTKDEFIIIINSIFSGNEKEYLLTCIYNKSYENDYFLFFLHGFNFNYKIRFINFVIFNNDNDDNTDINNIITCGYFFYKFRTEIPVRYNTVLKWNSAYAIEKFKNINKEYITIFNSLFDFDKNNIIRWFNKNN